MKSKFKEPYFWIVLIILFLPRILLEYNSGLIESRVFKIDTPWILLDQNNDILESDLEELVDLRYTEHKEERYWIYKNRVVSEALKVNDPAVFISRIGDSDIVYFNDCLIGSTGFKENLEDTYGWFWSHSSFYKVPIQCLEDENNIHIHVKKVNGPSFGLYSGYVGIGSHSQLEEIVGFNDLLRFNTIFIYGITLFIFISVYFLFLYVLIPEKRFNLKFSILSLSVGAFLILTSDLPFQYDINVAFLTKILFLSAALSGTYLFYFYNSKFSIVPQKFCNLFFLLSGILFIPTLFFKNANNVYQFYEFWHLLFVVSATFFFIKKIQYYVKKQDITYSRYFVAYLVLVSCIIHDMVSTLTGSDNSLMVGYGFMFVLGAAALSLAKEYADAFLYVEEQVSERTTELQTAVEQLKDQDAEKEQFFTSVSHDLKSPLTVALGTLSDLKDSSGSIIGQGFASIQKSLHELDSRIKSMLEDLRSGKKLRRLDMDKVNIAALLQEKADEISPLLSKDQIELKSKLQRYEHLLVPMDQKKMARVFENILSNARKYTRNTTRNKKVIQIRLKTDQAFVHIYFEDSGIGIPEAERAAVFKRFVQSSRTDLKEHGGTGIGLSFVKTTIEDHKGEVEMLESPWKGTTVHITLPLKQDVTMHKSTEESFTEDQSKYEGSLDVDYPPSEPSNIDSEKINLLSCEDKPEIAHQLHRALGTDYNFFFAYNGKDGLDILSKRKMDIIITDIQMPIMDGYEFIEKVRQNPEYSLIPIIIISSMDYKDDIIKGLELGAQDYLTKPIVDRDLMKMRINKEILQAKNYQTMLTSEKFASMGQFANSIAHEANQPLGTIRSGINTIGDVFKQFPDYETVDEQVQITLKKQDLKKLQFYRDRLPKASDKVIDLIKAMNAQTSGSKNKVQMDIVSVIQDAISMVEGKRKEKGNVEIEFAHDQPIQIHGYGAIQSVISNILSNALDAVSDKTQGLINVAIQDQQDRLKILIKDNGTGIEPSVIDKIFDPLVTTKDPQSGTGLGLYNAKMIVENMFSGKIHVNSELGKGTEFTVEIKKNAPELKDIKPIFHNYTNL